MHVSGGCSSGLATSELRTYNKLNQLTEVWSNGTVVQYEYYPDGLRASKTSNDVTTIFVLDGGNVVLETVDDIVTAKYIRTMNLVCSSVGGNLSYYLYNAHGDVVQLTNSDGTVTKTYVYDAFGVEDDPDSNDSNPFRYCGEYFDISSGTYYLRARYYSPSTGRFLAEDTHWNPTNMIYGDDPVKNKNYTDSLGLSVYVPNIAAIMQSGNLYVYCTSNPVKYHDPSGEGLSLSKVHNWVVDDIQLRYSGVGMESNKMIDYENGRWGFADLVSTETGEIWEVKKSTISMSKATTQLAKYVAGKLHNKKLAEKAPELYTGGSQGTAITERWIVKTSGLDKYYIHYWDCGNGIIQYEYDHVLNWEAAAALGWLILGGITFIISQGTYGTELIPQFA